MKQKWILFGCVGFGLLVISAVVLSSLPAGVAEAQNGRVLDSTGFSSNFDVDVLVNGRTLDEYRARGRTYVEALEGAEYEVRIHNRLPYRVGVALSVDGLNSIDASRTSAWNASKWVIEPYGTISVGGWQMSSEQARRFYFTSERDSYGAKLGKTANLGVISAVIFRERRAMPVPVTPPQRSRPYDEDSRADSKDKTSSAETRAGNSAGARRGAIAPAPDEDYAATGIGRSVQNDVRWVNMDLESRPTGEITIRYEYYPALVRLGVLPRSNIQPDPLRRREGATGFEDRRFSPEP